MILAVYFGRFRGIEAGPVLGMLLLLGSVAISQNQHQRILYPRANNYVIANNKYILLYLDQQDNQLEALEDLGHDLESPFSSLLGHPHSGKAHFPVCLCRKIKS